MPRPGHPLAAATSPRPRRPRTARRRAGHGAVATLHADDRARHGEGRRGSCVLPVQRLTSDRGRRRPVALRRVGRRPARGVRAATGIVAGRTRGPDDARHEALRGHPRAPAVLAEMPERWAATLSGLRAIARRATGRSTTCCGRPSSERGRTTALRAPARLRREGRARGAVGTSWESPTRRSRPVRARRCRRRCGAARDRGVRRRDHGCRSVELPLGEAAAAGRPGVPDVYQGTELWDLSSSTRQPAPVDYAVRRELLARIDGGWMPSVDESGAAKLLLVSRTPGLRRDRPDLFTRHTPLEAAGAASAHAIAFDRGGRSPSRRACRRARRARRLGRHRGDAPAGVWRDELTGREVAGGHAPSRRCLPTAGRAPHARPDRAPRGRGHDSRPHVPRTASGIRAGSTFRWSWSRESNRRVPARCARAAARVVVARVTIGDASYVCNHPVSGVRRPW
jgi:hypothetical protein